jgi:hypothetical protein
VNPNGMCHTRWKAEVGDRLAAVTARMIFSPADLATGALIAIAGVMCSSELRINAYLVLTAWPLVDFVFVVTHLSATVGTAVPTLPPLSPTIGMLKVIGIATSKRLCKLPLPGVLSCNLDEKRRLWLDRALPVGSIEGLP